MMEDNVLESLILETSWKSLKVAQEAWKHESMKGSVGEVVCVCDGVSSGELCGMLYGDVVLCVMVSRSNAWLCGWWCVCDVVWCCCVVLLCGAVV